MNRSEKTRPMISYAVPASAFVLAGIVLAFAKFSPLFRNGDGGYSALILTPLSASASIVSLGLTAFNKWKRAGIWFSLALISQAAALQLINAGWQLRYQHLKPFSELVSAPFVYASGLILLQAIVVATGLILRRNEIGSWLGQKLGPGRLLAFLAILVISATTVSENVWFYFEELALAGVILLVQLCNIALFIEAIPWGAVKAAPKVAGIFQEPEGDANKDRTRTGRFALGLAVFVFALTAALNLFSYQRHPHVPDEVVYLTQARFFAAGALTLPAPEVPEAFETYLMETEGGRWYPVTPPGWALILSAGVLLGIPWLVNPVLSGLNILLIFALIKRLTTAGTASMTILLIAFSPWYLFLGMSFMTHMTSLSIALIGAISTERAVRNGSAAWAAAAGASVGYLSLIRPLEAVAVGIVLAAWTAFCRGRTRYLARLAALPVLAAIIGSAGLLFNARLTGDPFRFPIMRYTDRVFGVNSNAYGFGADRGMGWPLDPYPGHGPVDALVNTNLNVSSLNAELFGWSIGSLAFVAVLLVMFRFRRTDLSMAGAIVLIYVLHFFYYYSGGPDFGARYWFLMLVPLAFLTARGIETFFGKDKQDTFRAHVLVLGLCAMTLVNYIPWRAADKYHNFRGMRPDVRELANEYAFGKSLVLVRGENDPDYVSAAVYNPLDLHSDATIYAWDRDAKTRKRLFRSYPGRPVWLIEGPSITGGGYRIIKGPVRQEDLR